MTRQVAVVPHTHWDREWYQSYQRLRHRLVDLLDRLLPRLEADPSSGTFLLDGQLAVVDDYLALRPERAGLIRDLATAGRLDLGPWYVLMDEFLVSGETIVRDLQLGLRTASAYGGASEVGYLPDMFGHIAQMPQLLRLAGLEHAVVWRGVPSAVDRTAFWWRSPDGSTVRAEYLPVGYGIGAHLPVEAGDLVRRMRAQERELDGLLAPDDPLLLMNGGDHLEPPEHLAELLEKVNADQDDFEMVLTSLSAYLAGAPTEALPSWSGELRSGARANLLMGVVSNRVDIRAAVAAAESALERRAEPLATLWLDAGRWPGPQLDVAWLQVIRNAAHDSVCACSADEVVTSVLHRYLEAEAIGDELAGDALAAAAAALPGPAVVNAAARPRSGVVEMVVPGDQVPAGAQVVQAFAAERTEVTGTGADLGRLLAELTTSGWLHDGTSTTASLRVDGPVVEVTLGVDAAALRVRSRGAIDGPAVPVGPRPAEAASTASVMAEAYAQAGARRAGALRVVVERAPALHVAVRIDDVPGYGWAVVDGAAPTTAGAVHGGDTWMDNGLVHLAVSTVDGTFSIDGVAGLGRLVDDGDEGDTYNYSPPAADTVVDRPESVAVEVVEDGPVRAILRVTRAYRWPAEVVDGRRSGSEAVTVTTDLELRAGEPAVRVTNRLVNRSRDHRLRAWIPLPSRAETSEAGCAFATVTRGLTAEGGPSERGLATYPARRFVTAGGLTVFTPGVAEYELVDDGRAVALTLLRATGYLSRPAPAYRPNAAGPPLAVEGPQMAGALTTRYAVAVGVADPWALADDLWLPLEVVAAPTPGDLPRRGSRLIVEGAEASSLRREGDHIELRVFNPTETATIVRVPGRRGWLVDLRGHPLEEWEGQFVLRAWGVATARLDP